MIVDRVLLAENNTLFQTLTRNLNNYPYLKASIRGILMEGTNAYFSLVVKESVDL